MEDIRVRWRGDTGTDLTVVLAGSSALARQIENGAPADVYISANAGWMDHLEKNGRIVPDSRSDLLRNRIVLIVPKASKVDIRIEPGFDLAAALGDGYLAMANTEAVPAGIYGKAALEALRAWPSVAGRIAQAADVRAALRLVSLGEAPFGIVYRTDANADSGVRVIGTFPPDSHPAIIYPAALTNRGAGNAHAEAFLAFLRSASARQAFERQGFDVIE